MHWLSQLTTSIAADAKLYVFCVRPDALLVFSVLARIAFFMCGLECDFPLFTVFAVCMCFCSDEDRGSSLSLSSLSLSLSGLDPSTALSLVCLLLLLCCCSDCVGCVALLIIIVVVVQRSVTDTSTSTLADEDYVLHKIVQQQLSQHRFHLCL